MESPATLADLQDRLDGLWATYLGYLDTYTRAQELLQKHMSSGFLSLARANFNARDGVTRYGKDFYSERAVAIKRAAIRPNELREDSKLQIDILSWKEPQPLETADQDTTQLAHVGAGEKDEEPSQQPSPPATPESEPHADSDEITDRSAEGAAEGTPDNLASHTEKAKQVNTLDPLRWFGILVPRELRSAQTSFSAAIEVSAADCLNAARALRECEGDVRKLRKEIRKAERSVESSSG
jgi:coiled-coil domain-containing protein 115